MGSGAFREAESRISWLAGNQFEIEVVFILPGDTPHQRRLRLIARLGQGQDAVAVDSIALELLRLALPRHLPDKMIALGERQRDGAVLGLGGVGSPFSGQLALFSAGRGRSDRGCKGPFRRWRPPACGSSR